MRLALISVATALLTGCVAAPAVNDGSDPVSATPGQVAAGHVLAVSRCAACHAVEPTGKSPIAAAPPFRQLSKRYPIDSLGEALAEGIVTGHPDMPDWVFERYEVTALLGYIDSIQTKRR